MTRTLLVADLAFTRSGDKGDTSDISVFARARGAADPLGLAAYDVLAEQVTAERVAELLDGWVHGPVTRYEVPRVLALKLVVEGALGGGGPASLRADNLGKALGGALLRLPVEVPDDLAQQLGPRPRPPADPYAHAAWRLA
jgi:hypothetical protein